MNKKNSYLAYVVFFISMILLIFLDQLSKYLIVKNFELYGKKAVIENFFYLYYVRNTGSAFSMLADVSWGIYLLSGISTIMALLICLLIIRTVKLKDYLSSAALTLVAAGAIGNLIDRFRLKYVVDFLRFDFGTYTFPIFNVADICAVVGTFLAIFIFVFYDKRVDAILDSFGVNKKKENEVNK